MVSILDGVGVTDQSGNGNDWTNNNLNLSTSTATTYDQMKDTPSLVDENAGNFCTLIQFQNMPHPAQQTLILQGLRLPLLTR
jgi:hypothetical protein